MSTQVLPGKPHIKVLVSRAMPGEENGPIVFIVTCPHCETETRLIVPAEGAVRWHLRGTLIQEAFPEMSDQDRESLISGVCPTCWTELERFAEETGAVT